MTHGRNVLIILLAITLQVAGSVYLNGQITPIGSGSYTTAFPGVDAANRNTYPSGTPQISGAAVGKPVPTNDWWSSLIKNDHTNNLFNYPMALKTTNPGLVVSYIPWGVYDDQEPIVVGVTGLNASKTTVSDYSDWTVTMDWNDGTHNLQATAGIAMPFLYFKKSSTDVVKITVNAGTVTLSGEVLIVENARSGADFVFYAPSGSSWTQAGKVYTSDLNGQDYWSMAMLPLTASNLSAVAEEYKKYAYVFPVNTSVQWNYNETTSVLRTDFLVETDTKEGTESTILMGLLPHQWDNLSADSPQPDRYSYSSIRGEIKTMDGNSFSVEDTFYGILPTLPYLANYSPEFSPSEMNRKISQIENDGLATWTDSYNEGQVMNRLIQTARIADQTGNTAARDKMIATIKERLEDWLTAEPSEIAFLFYYNSDWTTLIGYPAGHGQDGNINDHHFHWGYFIHAAAFMEQFEPGWSDQWGEMINYLVRDAASPNRNDDKFPFLRSFSPYAGHCWANGFATFPQGNDHESTSESMQFNSSLIHWGTVTGNDEIRDLGIYLYTTEQAAIEEYWLDVHERNFSESQQYSLVSRVWGNAYDNGTFWTSDIAASYGIEMYPIHGGSFYLGRDTAYVKKLWNEITVNTGILNNEPNPNLWHDIMWEYLSFIDPGAAIELYNSYPDRNLKFGVSDAQTYHWLHAMNAVGTLSPVIKADYPIAVAFNKEGEKTYVGHNYSNSPITITFSDGYILEVPANQMATSRDVDAHGILSADFNQAYANGSVNLRVATSGETISKVEFYDGNVLIGSVANPPYELKAENLALGVHGMYAKVYLNDLFNVTNIVSIQVGEQRPYLSKPVSLPGIIEAGYYDKFEGGPGQGISYVDVSQANEGGFRPTEYVDASSDLLEGATVGWISAGEWLEYSIDVQSQGKYNLSFRYASGNSSGGGPFFLEMDGQKISGDITVSSTGKWDSWTTKTVNDIELYEGEHILRVVFTSGEFNLGRMTFEYSGALGYSPPVALAGSNVVVLLPATTAELDGSQSYDPDSQSLEYSWVQVYGPSVINFTDSASASTSISNLVEGIYKCKLTVSDGVYSSTSYVLVIVSATSNITPSVAIISPANNSSYYEGSDILITASASDLDGTIALVEFYDGEVKIGEASADPYTVTWNDGAIGSHSIVAKVTDDGGAQGISSAITIDIQQAPSCFGVAENGDYSYRFSEENSNPTLTFIPGKSGVGSPTCILYYGTSEPFAGHNVTPNTPFRINASEGSLIYFYYTYSYDGMERNSYDSKHSYIVGSCSNGPGGILILYDNSFSIDENSPAGTLVGIPETEYTGPNTLSYSIISGNESGAFKINSESGEISVDNPAPLDYETTPSFSLEVEASDGVLTDVANITITLNNVVETGFGENMSLMAPVVYPNPVKDILTIEWSEPALSELYELSGRKVLISTEKQLNLHDLPEGIYFLELTGSGNQKFQFKIVKF